MKTISRVSCALSVCAAAAILAGCGGGSTSPSYELPGTSQSIRAQSVSSAVTVHDASCQDQRSFQYTGHAERFRVPKCATTIYIDAKGASGKYGGDGGEVGATIPVTPRETLIVTVGGAGQKFKGGFNGGGAGIIQIRHGRNKGRYYGAGGGGATDVRQRGGGLAQRVVVAGGGGGYGPEPRFWPRWNWRRSAGRRQWRNSGVRHGDSHRRWGWHAVLGRRRRSRKQWRLAGQRRRRCRRVLVHKLRVIPLSKFEQWRWRWLLRWRRGR